MEGYAAPAKLRSASFCISIFEGSVGVVDFAEALEFDVFSLEVFGDVVGGDFLVVC